MQRNLNDLKRYIDKIIFAFLNVKDKCIVYRTNNQLSISVFPNKNIYKILDFVTRNNLKLQNTINNNNIDLLSILKYKFNDLPENDLISAYKIKLDDNINKPIEITEDNITTLSEIANKNKKYEIQKSKLDKILDYITSKSSDQLDSFLKNLKIIYRPKRETHYYYYQTINSEKSNLSLVFNSLYLTNSEIDKAFLFNNKYCMLKIKSLNMIDLKKFNLKDIFQDNLSKFKLKFYYKIDKYTKYRKEIDFPKHLDVKINVVNCLETFEQIEEFKDFACKMNKIMINDEKLVDKFFFPNLKSITFIGNYIKTKEFLNNFPNKNILRLSLIIGDKRTQINKVSEIVMNQYKDLKFFSLKIVDSNHCFTINKALEINADQVNVIKNADFTIFQEFLLRMKTKKLKIKTHSEEFLFSFEKVFNSSMRSQGFTIKELYLETNIYKHKNVIQNLLPIKSINFSDVECYLDNGIIYSFKSISIRRKDKSHFIKFLNKNFAI